MKTYGVSNLYLRAKELSQDIQDTAEIEKENITELYNAEKERKLNKGELWNIEINGAVRKGKSTVGIAEGIDIHRRMREKGLTEEKKFTINNIARDQQEKSKMMRNPELNHTIVVVDEDNDLEKGGENSTVEAALRNVFSKVQAARYIHSINISPKETIDEESDMVLEVISQDKRTRTTLCYLYYKLCRAGVGGIHPQLVGHVIIPVGELINTWEDKVKVSFYKPKRSKKDEETIKKYMKEDLYTEYVVKKHEKMNMLTREGILRPRMLDLAGVKKETIEELREIAILTKSTELKDIIRNHIKIKMRKHKIPTSIVGEELEIREVNGALALYRAISKHQEEVKKLMMKPQTVKNIEEIRIRKKNIKIIEEGLKQQLAELEKYKEIKERYDKKE